MEQEGYNVADKKLKEKEEKAAPGVCVCGAVPCIVKHRRGFLVSCPDTMRCVMRSRWATTEQAAIKDWNTAVKSAKEERSATK